MEHISDEDPFIMSSKKLQREMDFRQASRWLREHKIVEIGQIPNSSHPILTNKGAVHDFGETIVLISPKLGRTCALTS